MLNKLSNTELDNRFRTLCKKESTLLSILIEHLVEIEKRKLFRELGYSSVFNYLTEALKYSEGEAVRRIKVARLVAKYPELLQSIKDRKISLTVLALIEPVVTEENANSLIAQVSDKSKREVERILVAYSAPKPKAQEKIKPLTEERYEISFSISKATMDKLRKAQAQSKHGYRLESLFDCLLDEYLTKRASKKKSRGSSKNTRYISKSDKELVLNRDGYQCSYISKDGTRCSCTQGLQFDHIKPFALGGETTQSNLRLLCANHNRCLAEKEFGKRF